MDERYYSTATVLFFVAAISISIYYRSRARRGASKGSRPGEGGPGLIAVRLVFLLGVVSFLTAYAVNPASTQWASIELPDWVRLTGLLLILIAIPSFIWLFRHLGANITPTANTREGHTLVVTGPYRWVRHPLYSTGIIFWLGMGLFAAKWFILMLAGAAVLFLMVRAPREEANLIEQFGDAYREYMAQTGRFLPRLFRSKSAAR